ncbi:TIGR01777 family oxidoreductase [Catenovulum sediminis]|uniref:TIGR01777 family oxidoreductase n=1 Tax=Catenovulum sediminis TaxID=1740262 RepID=A0ABV1RNE4_9ALTE
MKVLVTGGTGLIGRALIKQLKTTHQIYVLTRSPEKAFKLLGHDIEAFKTLPHAKHFTYDVIINLAGEPIADKRWSSQQKNKICQSRWQITQDLVDRVKECEYKPKVIISGSAIGFYGRQAPTTEITENNFQVHDEFTHQVCLKWENIVKECEEQARVCRIRTGIVLAKKGGALSKMKPAFLCGLGGPIASGEQMMSWIHIDDAVAAIQYLMYNKACSGAYNLTAPQPVSNKEFSKQLGQVLNRPTFFTMPESLLKILLGEMSELLTTGQAVIPQRLEEHGFTFHFPNLKMALKSCIGKHLE